MLLAVLQHHCISAVSGFGGLAFVVHCVGAAAVMIQIDQSLPCWSTVLFDHCRPPYRVAQIFSGVLRAQRDSETPGEQFYQAPSRTHYTTSLIKTYQTLQSSYSAPRQHHVVCSSTYSFFRTTSRLRIYEQR